MLWSTRRPHYGDPVACLRDLLAGMPAALAPEGCGGIAATGSGAGALAEAGAALPVLEDVPAIASGAKIMAPEARSVIEIGGQNAYFVCRLAAAVPEFAMNELRGYRLVLRGPDDPPGAQDRGLLRTRGARRGT
ncbi:MAG: hypothetical protein ACLS3Y_00300 [Collinsella sp.]